MPTKRPANEISDEEGGGIKKLHADNADIEALAPVASIHDAADEELDTSGMPVGWRECPKMGAPVWRLIPMKVPLGPAFDPFIPNPEDRFTVESAVKMSKQMLEGVQFSFPDPNSSNKVITIPAECSMVVDLTNSSRYYRHESFEELNFYHVKIPNRGRGEVPAPQAVNDFVFEVMSYLDRKPAGYVLVHCTHGFNRSGYMIVSYLLRMLADAKTRVETALAAFASARPPGIYKEYYIRHLFRYYHQRPPQDLPPPAQPEWKGAASPDRGLNEEDEGDFDEAASVPGAVGETIQHDDPLGEPVCLSEANWVRSILMQYILSRGDCPPENCVFPGSQPVSLARSNIDLLHQKRYWVTWKADGTRYLILLHRAGTYLIDRANRVTRVQMRWPMPLPPHPGGSVRVDTPVGPPHSGTILDGEMVVDEDMVSGQRTRRFLAYDLVSLNGDNMVHLPWSKRWGFIDEFIERPRRKEQEEIGKGRWNRRYDYSSEPFRFRRKTFWPLSAASKVIHDFIPHQVSHEADGLILQPYDDAYVALTYPELLKWKFAHMNSVDFRLKVVPQSSRHSHAHHDLSTPGPPDLALELLRPTKHHTATIEELKGAKVVFPQGELLNASPELYNGRIIECAWDGDLQAWSFMRERRDKTLPNAETVYEKVWASIKDNITEEDLLLEIEQALKKGVYDEDMGRGRHG